MKIILIAICFCAAAVAQPSGGGVFPPPTKPACTATRTTNCSVTADSSGAVSVTTALLAPVTLATSSPATVTSWGFWYNNAAGAMTFTLPAITSGTVGAQYCFRNYVTRSGAITIQSPASTFISMTGTNGSSGGTLVSAGALGDSACVVATSTTQYIAYISLGTWTNN